MSVPRFELWSPGSREQLIYCLCHTVASIQRGGIGNLGTFFYIVLRFKKCYRNGPKCCLLRCFWILFKMYKPNEAYEKC